MSLQLTSLWTDFVICKYLFCHSDRSMEILKLCSLQILKDICKVLNMIFCYFPSYLVMPFMGTDLGKLMKMQKLSEEKIQYLVYQMLKGLKVRSSALISCQSIITMLKYSARCIPLLQYIHSAGIIHRVGSL